MEIAAEQSLSEMAFIWLVFISGFCVWVCVCVSFYCFDISFLSLIAFFLHVRIRAHSLLAFSVVSLAFSIQWLKTSVCEF